MHAAFLKKRPYKAKFVIISREASTVDLPRGVNNIKERVVLLIYHTFSVFNIHVFSCCLQNVYVLIVDNYVKTYVSVLFTIT